jgi:peptidoglycan/xylan/chitin deacetylase (PgdA/CDA1 family)
VARRLPHAMTRGLRRTGSLAARLQRRNASRAVILMYHRVADGLVDPWGLAVGTANFRSQIETIARDWHPVSLDELVHAVRLRAVRSRAVAVTFDDGYADNLEAAAPILVEHGVPATVFVTTGLVARASEPWWDELTALVLEREDLPDTLTLQLGGAERRFRVPPPTEDDRPPHVNRVRPWLARRDTRLEAYYRIWTTLRAAGPAERERLLAEIAHWAGMPRRTRPRPSMLSEPELRELAALPGVDIGCHTVTHPVLSLCSPEAQRGEVAGSVEWMRRHLDLDARHFAYPFGEWDAAAAAMVEELGLRSACTTTAGPVWRRSPVYALPRVPVDDCDGTQLDQRLGTVLAL